MLALFAILGFFAKDPDIQRGSTLVAEYTLTEGSGTVAHNFVPGGGDLTINAAGGGWVTAGYSFATNISNSRMSGTFPSTTLTAATYYAVFKWDSNAKPFTTASAVFCGQTFASAFRLMAAGGTTVGTNKPVPYASQASVGTDVNMSYTVRDGIWHVMAGVYHGSSIRLYIDDALVGTNAAGSSAITVTNIQIADSTAALPGQTFPGIVSYAALYRGAHTYDQVVAHRAAFAAKLYQRGRVVNSVVTNYVVTVGDSICYNAAAALWDQLNTNGVNFTMNQPGGYQMFNRAVSGTGITQFDNDKTNIWALFTTRTNDVYVLWGGRNTMASLGSNATLTQLTNLVFSNRTLCLQMRTNGANKIVVVDWIHNLTNGWFNTNIDICNGIIQSDTSWYDARATVMNDTNLSPATPNNAMYVSDGTGSHPSVAGNAILAPIIASAILGLPDAPTVPESVNNNIVGTTVSFNTPALPARATNTLFTLWYNRDGAGWNNAARTYPASQTTNTWDWSGTGALPATSFLIRFHSMTNAVGTGAVGAQANVPLI